jgi:hypothetical protein
MDPRGNEEVTKVQLQSSSNSAQEMAKDKELSPTRKKEGARKQK